MKKLLTILCALALSITCCFVGCSDDSAPSKNNGGGSNGTQDSGGDGWTDNY